MSQQGFGSERDDFVTVPALPGEAVVDLQQKTRDLIDQAPISNEERAKLRELWARVAELLSGRRLSLYELFGILWTAVDLAVRIVESFSGLPVEARKQIVMAFVGDLIDAYVLSIDLPGVPDYLERNFVDPALRKILMSLAEQAVDSLVSWYSSKGGAPAVIGPIILR